MYPQAQRGARGRHRLTGQCQYGPFDTPPVLLLPGQVRQEYVHASLQFGDQGTTPVGGGVHRHQVDEPTSAQCTFGPVGGFFLGTRGKLTLLQGEGHHQGTTVGTHLHRVGERTGVDTPLQQARQQVLTQP